MLKMYGDVPPRPLFQHGVVLSKVRDVFNCLLSTGYWG